MRTYACTSCDVYWAPYMVKQSACPQCRGGLAASQEPMTKGAVELYAATRVRDLTLRAQAAARADSVARHERFEDFYFRRERERDAARPRVADSLEDLAELPTLDPEAI